jgi:uncharacterized protein YciI
MSGDAAKIRAAVEAHVSYWKSAQPANYIGGPFADRSGGLIMFDAATADEANDHVRADPFVTQALVVNFWVKEWRPE